MQNPGTKVLADASDLRVIPTGEFLAILYGGGYYFVPPIPNRSIANKVSTVLS
jgi:hypothetical protein